MLKALELVGFKSFADKTRFEFPEGITVVVGPNGSGKSNVVDAIKWVLGEQSAKSLRGRDMADVIFKGADGGRKPMNTAEATIVFDNSDRRLKVDTSEVHVTRRVYRSGEGEYLINREPCRLRDIRDMFRGTGVGTDAYSLIEQGKVDRLLQASPKDRRAIFEEAAGISRFKAKKVESQRRLERVEQNLVRLADIVDEVQGRLKNVRGQAAKARRYREYSQRLQELRTHVGRADYQALSDQLDAAQTQLDSWRAESTELEDECGVLDSQSAGLEKELETLSDRVRAAEAKLAEVGEQLVAEESRSNHQRARVEEFLADAKRYRIRLAAMTGRAGEFRERIQEVEVRYRAAESEVQQQRALVDEQMGQLTGLQDQIAQRREAAETQRQQLLESMRTASELAAQLTRQRAESDRCETHRLELNDQLAQVKAEQAAVLDQFEAARNQEQRLQRQVNEQTQRQQNLTTEIEEASLLLNTRQEHLARLQGRMTGLRERADDLQRLEEKWTGAAAGTAEVLRRAKAGEPPFDTVRGVVADLLEVPIAVAPLVDAALGIASQCVVVDGLAIWEHLQSGALQLQGAVSVLPLQEIPSPSAEGTAAAPPDFSELPGVIGRGDRLVACPPEYTRLKSHLLGRTWFVRDLATAMELRGRTRAPLRFVTLDGEALQPDGTLQLHAAQASGNLISRRSELRTVRREIQELQEKIKTAEQESEQLRARLATRRQQAQALREQGDQLRQELAERKLQRSTLQQTVQRWNQTRLDLEQQLQQTIARRDEFTQSLASLQLECEAAGQLTHDLEAGLEELGIALEGLELQRQQAAAEVTRVQVELARKEQQLDGLGGQLTRYQEDRKERERAVAEAREQLLAATAGRERAELAILQATSQTAELYLAKERLAEQIQQIHRGRQEHQLRRRRLLAQRDKQLDAVRKLENKIHRQELTCSDLSHQRNTLAERLRDDYGIDLSELAAESGDAVGERAEIDQEIADLRRKINQIGAINMEALEELEELEKRYANLHSQYQDLEDAKEALKRIIHKINADSRRLFLETLEAIRTNFRTLYRQSFGGGTADLVLEDGVDVLESGVEIVATPPGKPSFNNSLLSGGEKALTAVSLLLAIFQFRPSPFCVLDEVDAPFDEANIGRFINVLREFLGWTKFVVVTHSKKTMTAATTLYGVTMQESGVSKRVSVRFEDVSEDGHIREEALRRQEASAPDAESSQEPAGIAGVRGDGSGDGGGDDERAA